ncbi:MAG: BMP family ABC transporter substrate-binding protein [Oscillospiraceae bacterium]|nr:BMP family ABC transporter substrate-binding protein [Oscillospiraceae bacterium]
MKKMRALLLALAMLVALCSCGSKKEEPAPEVEDRDAAVVFENSSETVDVTALVKDYADQLSKTKVGFIFLHDENSTYDNNFMAAGIEACDSLGVEYILKTNIPEGQECYEAACDLADSGCNIVFADSFGHEAYMIQAAKEYTDVQFCHATGVKAHTEGLSNYHNAFASIYEARYLAGVAAGLKLNEMIDDGKITAEEAKMGYVGAYTYAEVISGYTSFYLGAKSVCPTVTVDVTFAGSGYDETAEKEGAQKLIDNGGVLISQHADSMGAPTACETAGVPNVSYNGSTIAACPNTFLVSSRINWVPYMQYMIGKTAMSEKISTDWTGNLETASVQLTDLNEAVAAAGTAEKLAEVSKKLSSGEVKVFDAATFTVNGEKVSTYLADINDWGDYTGETEAIVNGAFAESSNRSAPAFDLRIDGITLLDEFYG